MTGAEKSSGETGAARKESMGGLAKGLDVLLSFGRGAPQLTLSEIADRTGLGPATARRCLLTLQELGYVNVNRRHFYLTTRVLDLSTAFLESFNIERLATPYLEQLAQETGDSASLTVLRGQDIVYLARASARMLMRLEAFVGSRFPAFATATGRVLLAACSDDQLASRLHGPFPALTDVTVTDPKTLLQHVRDARRDGYAAVEDELAYGVVSLAVPLTDSSGRVIAALNSSGHSKKTSKKEMIDDRLALVIETGRKLSDELSRVPHIGLILGDEGP
jgi:IclR family pca regulon transcriptional regulator